MKDVKRSDHRTRKQKASCQGTGLGERRKNESLMGTEFQFRER